MMLPRRGCHERSPPLYASYAIKPRIPPILVPLVLYTGGLGSRTASRPKSRLTQGGFFVFPTRIRTDATSEAANPKERAAMRFSEFDFDVITSIDDAPPRKRPPVLPRHEERDPTPGVPHENPTESVTPKS